jgi:hypothetical protein
MEFLQSLFCALSFSLNYIILSLHLFPSSIIPLEWPWPSSQELIHPRMPLSTDSGAASSSGVPWGARMMTNSQRGDDE